MSEADSTIVKMMDSPDDVKVVVASLTRRAEALESKLADQQDMIDEAERFLKPFRWVFNKVAAGVGFAIAAAILAWFGLGQ